MRNKTTKKNDDPWQLSYQNVFAVIGQIFDEAGEPSRSVSRDGTILRSYQVLENTQKLVDPRTTLKVTLF